MGGSSKVVRHGRFNTSNSSVYNQFRKLLKKEGLSKNSETSNPIRPRKPGTVKKGNKKHPNRLLQTYKKVNVKGKSKEDIAEMVKEQNKIRREKLKNKKERQRQLNRRTKKGQPVMNNRVEMMLEKIMSDKDTYQS